MLLFKTPDIDFGSLKKKYYLFKCFFLTEKHIHVVCKHIHKDGNINIHTHAFTTVHIHTPVYFL